MTVRQIEKAEWERRAARMKLEATQTELLTRYYRVKEHMPKILHQPGSPYLWTFESGLDPWGTRNRLSWPLFECMISYLEVKHGVRKPPQRAECATGTPTASTSGRRHSG